MKIWIDIDNAPHAQVMEPVIKELRNRGNEILVTARDYGQTVEMLEMKNIPYQLIGKHPGRSTLLKVFFLFYRMIKLYLWALDKRIDLAFSHGSRSMILPARFLGIPVVVMYDYEYISDFLFRKFAKVIFMPQIANDGSNEKVIDFPGLKEELYIWEHDYDNHWDRNMVLDEEKIIVILRPPASMAHYHSPEADKIFKKLLDRVSEEKNIECILIPRTRAQGESIEKLVENCDNITVPSRALDAISMFKKADVLVGGGGTMNREAALMGVKVFSIFQGKKGKIDRWLEEKGRLQFIESVEDVDKIELKSIVKLKPLTLCSNLQSIICDLLEKVCCHM